MLRAAFRCAAIVLAFGVSTSGQAQPVRTVAVGDYSFDPAQGLPQELARIVAFEEPGPGVEHWRIIQVYRAPDRASQSLLRDRYGLELRRYVRGGAYLEWTTVETARGLQAAQLARASVPYHPALKYSRSIGDREFVSPERRAVQGLLLRAVLFDHPAIDIARAEELIDALPGTDDVRLIDERSLGGAAHIVFRLASRADLPMIARLDAVSRIEEVGEIIEDNFQATTILQSGLAGNASIWAAGLTGNGQTVNVVEDRRPDFNHCFLSAPGKVVADRHPSTAVTGAHSTFIAGSVLGDAANALGQYGKHPYRGGAWNARLIAGSNNNVSGPDATRTILAELAAVAEDENATAYIHTNSWHDETEETADINSDAVNAFVWGHENHLVLGSIANAVDQAAHGPPGTAKNALAVAAVKKTMSIADPLVHAAGLSGPYQGRRKPDLAAVGCDIVSAVRDATNTCKTGIYDPSGEACSTSSATAHAAATAALVRQYFAEGWYPSGAPQMQDRRTPSGALLKATLLNSTRDNEAIGPTDETGWGAITLDRTLSFPWSDRDLRIWDVLNSDPMALVTETHDYIVTIASPGVPLKVSLVWTDEPSDTALVNDLDLEVVAPDIAGRSIGSTYLGNHFMLGVSALGGAADNANNVEQVLIKDPDAGSWVIRVKATNVFIGSQGYALVVTGGLTANAAVQPNPPAFLNLN